jgi:hypothetical protein
VSAWTVWAQSPKTSSQVAARGTWASSAIS